MNTKKEMKMRKARCNKDDCGERRREDKRKRGGSRRYKSVRRYPEFKRGENREEELEREKI